MKNLITLSVLLTCFVSFGSLANVTQVEHFQVKQDSVNIVTAQNSGLDKALCEFKDSNGGRVVRQVVTVVETYDNITIIETRLYNGQPDRIQSVICEG